MVRGINQQIKTFITLTEKIYGIKLRVRDYYFSELHEFGVRFIEYIAPQIMHFGLTRRKLRAIYKNSNTDIVTEYLYSKTLTLIYEHVTNGESVVPYQHSIHSTAKNEMIFH